MNNQAQHAKFDKWADENYPFMNQVNKGAFWLSVISLLAVIIFTIYLFNGGSVLSISLSAALAVAFHGIQRATLIYMVKRYSS